jgi:mono/diheme cytochrome c family protein
LLLALGCDHTEGDNFDNRMVVQPKYNPMDPSRFFADGQSARPPVEGTIPIGGYPNEVPLHAVSSVRSNVKDFPFALTRKDLERGQLHFRIYCSVCHGQLGDGNGMIPQRGLTHPPSFYLPRLRQAPPGHFYDVITNGYGAMYSYNDRVSPADRWRIAGYIRALQLSDPANTGIQETPPSQRK